MPLPNLSNDRQFFFYLHPDIKLCNCAKCKCELLGGSMEEWFVTLDKKYQATLPPLVYGLIPVRMWNSRREPVQHYRPYCKTCYLRTAKLTV